MRGSRLKAGVQHASPKNTMQEAESESDFESKIQRHQQSIKCGHFLSNAPLSAINLSFCNFINVADHPDCPPVNRPRRQKLLRATNEFLLR
jgi:hypothetical protein